MMFIVKKNLKRFLARRNNFSPFFYAGGRILLYHSVGGKPQDHPLAIRVRPENFEKQLKEIIKSGYKSVTVTEMIEDIPLLNAEKRIAITFDDGYKDNIAVAAERLSYFKLKATFFISTLYIDKQGCKKWRDGSLREYLSWEDILKLSDMGFEIGSHMVHHIDLTALGDYDLRFELISSKKKISEKIGKQVKTLSYPYGKINERVIRIAEAAGYIGGCSSFPGFNYLYTNRHILRRTEVDGYDTISDFGDKLNGLYDREKRYLNER